MNENIMNVLAILGELFELLNGNSEPKIDLKWDRRARGKVTKNNGQKHITVYPKSTTSAIIWHKLLPKSERLRNLKIYCHPSQPCL